MKAFSFEKIAKKLDKKSQKSVQEKQSNDNFLKLYEDIPSDPQMDIYCLSAEKEFNEKLDNHRYFSYELEKEPVSAREKYRLEAVKKIRNFQLGFKPQVKPAKGPSQKQIEQRRMKEEIRRKLVRQKFRRNIKIVIEKLKKLKMKVDDVIKLGIFSKEPYRFGKEIFDAIKEANEEKVWRILLVNKLAIFSVDNTVKSPLIWSCIRGHSEITKMLLDVGADINHEDQNGFNSLYYAIKYDSPECVQLLMLKLSWFGEHHSNESLSASERVRNVFRLGCNLTKAMKNIEEEKRQELFNQQYKYFYS